MTDYQADVLGRFAAIVTAHLGGDGALVNRLINCDSEPRELVAAGMATVEVLLRTVADREGSTPAALWREMMLGIQAKSATE